jgi:hypothetical protein
MKKLFISLLVLVFIVVVAGGGALYYINPAQKLDLSYEEVALEKNAYDMARRQSTEMIITGADLNNLAKKSVAANPEVQKDIVVTGALFTLENELLIADINLRWKNRISAGIEVTYRLRWDNSDLTATVESARMKGIKLPAAVFPDRVIPIAQELPRQLKIKELVWGNGEVKVLFEKPTLQELQELMG